MTTKVYAVIEVYDIGSGHPESNVELFMTREEAEANARSKPDEHYLWENDPDLTQEDHDQRDYDDSYRGGYIRVEEFILPI